MKSVRLSEGIYPSTAPFALHDACIASHRIRPGRQQAPGHTTIRASPAVTPGPKLTATHHTMRGPRGGSLRPFFLLPRHHRFLRARWAVRAFAPCPISIEGRPSIVERRGAAFRLRGVQRSASPLSRPRPSCGGEAAEGAREPFAGHEPLAIHGPGPAAACMLLLSTPHTSLGPGVDRSTAARRPRGFGFRPTPHDWVAAGIGWLPRLATRGACPGPGEGRSTACRWRPPSSHACPLAWPCLPCLRIPLPSHPRHTHTNQSQRQPWGAR